MIGPVVKIDEHMNATIRGRFARMTVCVDLKKLISKMCINGKLQRVEYESFAICLLQVWLIRP